MILDGKLSFREEEEPKLLVDASVRWMGATPPSAWAEPLKVASGAEKTRKEPRREPMPPAAPVLTDAQLAKRAQRKLYVLAPSRAELETIRRIAPRIPERCPSM